MITLSVRRPTSNADSFLASNGLAFGSVMPAVEIQPIFQKHDAMFGNTYNGIYTTAIVLWAYLSQVLADEKMRSCTTAVARIVAFRIGNNRHHSEFEVFIRPGLCSSFIIAASSLRWFA